MKSKAKLENVFNESSVFYKNLSARNHRQKKSM